MELKYILETLQSKIKELEEAQRNMIEEQICMMEEQRKMSEMHVQQMKKMKKK